MIVSVEPEESPASLKLQTRLEPLIEEEVALLMKCGLPANAAGIRLQGNMATIPVARAVVTGNYVRMTAPSDSLAGSENAGIELRRATTDAVIENNLIHGVGRTALSVASEPGRVSMAATLWLDSRWFTAGPTQPGAGRGADVIVGPASTDTHVTGGPGSFSVDDQGIRTIVEHWN